MFIIKYLLHTIKLCGGLKGTFKRAVLLYHREGLSGAWRKFRIMANIVGRNNYSKWICCYDTLTDEIRTIMRDRMDNFEHKPLISVLMPVYNPNPEWLIEAIESVRKQIYQCWELCIADDASTDERIRIILNEYASKDKRVKVVFRESNGHISAASNSALELVSGEWVALLDHDDLIAEHALFCVADTIHKNPDIRLIYSDEDKINQSGKRFDPYFKCDWNEDLFYSQNMISHLGVYRADLLKEICGFREGLEGSQDYDLALRCIERIRSSQIYHIPRVLYHWRVHDNSAAQGKDNKPYAHIAGARTLNEHFRRQGVDAHAESLDFGMYRVRYALPEKLPMVSIIIPTRNQLSLFRRCIKSILNKTTYPNYEIIIIDNGSDDPLALQYFVQLQADPRILVVRDDCAFNYSALNNAAVTSAKGDIVALLNNDIEVISPEWLSEMVSHAMRPGIGAVGARLLYPDNTLQHGGVVLGIGGAADHAHRFLPCHQYGYFGRARVIQSYSAVTGACLVIRKSIYDEVGGMNENDFQVSFGDIDFCLRVREKGYRNIWTPYAKLYHHESASRGYDNSTEKQLRAAKEASFLTQRWLALLLNDTAYSPNLSINISDFSLSWPPRVDLLGYPCKKTVQQYYLDRVDKAFCLINRKGLGLEIGPSHNPLAPKKAGFNVQIVDHTTREELIKKYRDEDVNLDNIEEVDFVWKGEPLQSLIGETGCYDWIVASHVIEHIPDFISFLQQCEALLKPEGILSLIIPDKRYCFDYFSLTSTTGDVLDAHAERRVKPSHGQVFNHFANAVKKNDKGSWSPVDMKGEIKLYHTLDEARMFWEKSVSSKDYIDVHCWRFTPASFRLLISDLQKLDLIGLEIKKEFDTTGCEFFVSLGKGSNVRPELDRCTILQTIKLEKSKMSQK